MANPRRSFEPLMAQGQYNAPDEPATPATPCSPTDNIDILSEQFRNGIVRKDLRYHLSDYRQVFTGCDAVQWIQQNSSFKTVEEALEIGNALIDKKVFAHVTRDHPLKNEHKFYRMMDSRPDLMLVQVEEVLKFNKITPTALQEAKAACDSGKATVDWFKDTCGLGKEDKVLVNRMFEWACQGDAQLEFSELVHFVHTFGPKGNMIERVSCMWYLFNKSEDDFISADVLIDEFVALVTAMKMLSDPSAAELLVHKMNWNEDEMIGFPEFSHFIMENDIFPTLKFSLRGKEPPKTSKPYRLGRWLKRDRFANLWVVCWAIISITSGLRMGLPFIWKEGAWDLMGPGVVISRFSAGMMLINVPLLVLMMCSWIMEPISRTFLSHYIPIQHSKKFHIHIACHVLADLCLHIGGHIFNFWNAARVTSVDQLNAAFRPEFTEIHPYNYYLFQTVVGTTGILMTVMMITMSICAHKKIRTKRFWLFYFTHRMFWPVVILFMIHGMEGLLLAPTAHYYMGPVALLLLGQNLRAFFRTIRGTRELTVCKVHSGSTLQLGWKVPQDKHIPGQYVRILIPSVSKWDWHAFTISSSPMDENMTVHVSCKGKWTGRLLECMKDKEELNPKQRPGIKWIGPYSAPTQTIVQTHGPVVLVGAGIGATPFASIIPWMIEKRTADVHFHWIAPSLQGFDWMGARLLKAHHQAMKNNHWFTVSLYATREATCIGWALTAAVQRLLGKDDLSQLKLGTTVLPSMANMGKRRRLKDMERTKSASRLTARRRRPSNISIPISDGDPNFLSVDFSPASAAHFTTPKSTAPTPKFARHPSTRSVTMSDQTKVIEVPTALRAAPEVTEGGTMVTTGDSRSSELRSTASSRDMYEEQEGIRLKAPTPLTSSVFTDEEIQNGALEGPLQVEPGVARVEMGSVINNEARFINLMGAGSSGSGDASSGGTGEDGSSPPPPGGPSAFQQQYWAKGPAEKRVTESVREKQIDGEIQDDTFLRVLRDRPDWDSIMTMYRFLYPNQMVDFFYCGNDMLGDQIEEACHKHSNKPERTVFNVTREVFG